MTIGLSLKVSTPSERAGMALVELWRSEELRLVEVVAESKKEKDGLAARRERERKRKEEKEGERKVVWASIAGGIAVGRRQ